MNASTPPGPGFDLAVPRVPDHTGWSDSSARMVLQLMADSVAEMVGFHVVSLSVTLDAMLVTVAYAGPDEHREEVFDAADPVAIIEPILTHGRDWGRLRFLPFEDQHDELQGTWVQVVAEVADVADAWHPHDVLVAPLRDEAGDLIGVLSLDQPVTGRRPDARQRALLERYAAQAERAVQTAFEREELVRQVAHADATRRLVRAASMRADSSLEEVLIHTHSPLVEGFDAPWSWVQVFGDDSDGVGYARWRGGQRTEVPEVIVGAALALAPLMWAEQRVLTRQEDGDAGPQSLADEELLTLLAAAGLPRPLVVPLGAGRPCVGVLVLSREPEHDPWSPTETAAARDLGHDLGAALVAAQALERKRRLVSELEAVNVYRSQLISTVSHELRTPLTVIAGNLELMEGLDLGEAAETYEAAIGRGTRRMQHLVDDLLVLAQVSHPGHPAVEFAVDLDEVLADVVDLFASGAAKKGVCLTGAVIGKGPFVMTGDPLELDRLVSNLVANALKYTAPGGRVEIRLTRVDAEIVIEVLDDGIGIGADDLPQLFDAFYRSNDPAARSEPGTGLGLAIVANIVERHHGRISVDSVLGQGSVFTARFAAARSGDLVNRDPASEVGTA